MHRSMSAIGCVLLAATMPALADSGVGVDTWLANEFDPDAGAGLAPNDARGTSWLRAGESRSPGGNLYLCPAEPPRVAEHGDWQAHGLLRTGVVATSGDDGNALWNRYRAWNSGFLLGLLEFELTRAADGSHAHVRASRISDDDAWFEAAFGRAGAYKVRAFLRELPHALSHNVRSIWDGVGGNRLELRDGLSAGSSTPAQVAAVSAAAAPRTLSVQRSKQGLGVSAMLDPRWSAYADFSSEQRKGARPFGGSFFFNYPFPDNGGVLETLKPIDDATLGVNAGLRHAGPVWRLDLGYQGSFYRDRYTRYTYEMPFALAPVIPGALSAPLTTGQFATEPDNDYHNLRATLTRVLARGGEISLSAASGRMTQNDRLIAPIDCQGVFGIGLAGSLALGAQNPFLHDCADWNSPASLSRERAGMRIDTSLLDGRFVLGVLPDLRVRGGLRFHREDYRDTYLAFNPLTGQYGYVAENGAQGSVVPGEIGFWDATTSPSANTRVRSLPLDLQTIEADLGIDWKLGARNTFAAAWNHRRHEPSHRERETVRTDSLKLTWVNRAFDALNLRANLTVLRQDGDRYDADPYAFTYSRSLPGFVEPAGGLLPHTVDALRKYDVGSRDETRLDLMATIMPRDDMTVGVTLRGDRRDYDAELGRRSYDTGGVVLQWEWQPSTRTRVSAHYGHDRSRLGMANVNDAEFGSDPALGGVTYPDGGRWWADDEQRDDYAGLSFVHQAGRVRFELDWNHIDARGVTRTRFATPAALAYFADGFVADNAFPPLAYRVDGITLGLSIALGERIGLRLFDTWERARVEDWHYSGFDAGYVLDHRVYADGGPEGYRANLVGLLFDVRL